jgi:hypothetical protein
LLVRLTEQRLLGSAPAAGWGLRLVARPRTALEGSTGEPGEEAERFTRAALDLAAAPTGRGRVTSSYYWTLPSESDKRTTFCRMPGGGGSDVDLLLRIAAWLSDRKARLPEESVN